MVGSRGAGAPTAARRPDHLGKLALRLGQIVTLSASQLSASAPIAIDVTQLINQRFNVNGIASFVIGVISSPGGFGPSKPGARGR